MFRSRSNRSKGLCNHSNGNLFTRENRRINMVPANLMLGGGEPCDGLASHPGRSRILLVASCYVNRDKLRPDGPLGSYADVTY